jgi:hypothetical protein
MSFTTPRTWITGETVTCDEMNQQLRDNQNETWKYSSNGDLMYGASATTSVKLPIGSNGNILSVVSGVPAWLNVFCNRVGGDSSSWNISGSSNYAIEGNIQIEMGYSAILANRSWVIVPFSSNFQINKVFAFVTGVACGLSSVPLVVTVAYSAMTVGVANNSYISVDQPFSWLAIGLKQ